MDLKKIIGLVLILPLGPGLVHSQKKEKEIIAISAGTGVLTFHGDVGGSSVVGAYSFIRSGFNISAEKYFNKNFALSLNMLKGKIARDEKSSDKLPQLNFESPLMQFGLSGTFLIAGKNEPAVIPFISAGFSWLSFDPHGDMLDASGKSYYYWNDGSIRDLPQTGLNYFYAKNIERDYKYETKLTDSASNYSRSAFALPVSLGVKMKLTSRLDANIGLTYHLSFSDYLDNVKKAGPDAYLYSSAGLTFHFYSLSKKDKEEVSQLFAEMDKADSDHDGVLDANDLCQGTPKGVKVDSKGCPTDSDADGVADYLDKEPHSKAGVLVDENGVELTKARLKEMNKEGNVNAASRTDALSNTFNQKPSAEFMKQVEEMQKENRKNPEAASTKGNIPYDLRVADWDKDGFVSSDEIAKTIDSFFDGSITFSVEQINRLIDYFFDQ